MSRGWEPTEALCSPARAPSLASPASPQLAVPTLFIPPQLLSSQLCLWAWPDGEAQKPRRAVDPRRRLLPSRAVTCWPEPPALPLLLRASPEMGDPRGLCLLHGALLWHCGGER